MQRRFIGSAVVLAAALVLTAPGAPAQAQQTQGAVPPRVEAGSGGARDFDFLVGTWRMQNRRLKERLKGSKEWIEFESTLEMRLLPGDLGNQDTFRTEFWPGFVGVAFRIFNPATKLWSIYWVDNRRRIVDPPLVGSFTGNVGVFEGDDTLDGRPIRVRFKWTRVGKDRARWEQAFSPDGGKTWETNWEQELTRTGG
jgi:hypothetical protein